MQQPRPIGKHGPHLAEVPRDTLAQRTLGISVERLLSSLDDSPIGTVLTDLDGRWLRVNRAFAQMVGYAREELTGLSFEALTHPADVETDHDYRKKLARGEIAQFQRAKRYLHKDGSTVVVQLNVSVLRDDDGAPICFLSQMVDITERVRADEALRKSESNYRRMFDQASDGIFVCDVDLRFTDVNAAGCQLLGFSRQDILGKTIADLLPAEDIPRLDEQREQLLVDGGADVKEWSVRHADGNLVPVEVSTKFLLDGRMVSFVRDISERKRAEREREESFRWMRAVLEQSPVGLLLFYAPRPGHFESNSHFRRMVGRPVTDLQQLAEVLRMPDGQPLEPHVCPAKRALQGDACGEELVLHDANGGTRQVVATAAPIFGADDSVLGCVCAVQDVTATKELERLRAEWSSVVAHDLRQPLTTISLSADALSRSTDDSRLRLRFERIRAAAHRLNRMVGDLMDLSRLEARRLELVRQRIDVPALVRACVERMALTAPDRPAHVRVEGDVPEADADPDRIAQVMDNLLTNAVKYGHGGTPIVVGVEPHGPDGSEIAISVTNEGRALAAEELSLLFQRFQRTASAKLQGIEGTGLGLYITRSLVEAHGGRIAAECTAGGTMTFRFTLPAALGS
jgi:PAS domain S-box-containing protein